MPQTSRWWRLLHKNTCCNRCPIAQIALRHPSGDDTGGARYGSVFTANNAIIASAVFILPPLEEDITILLKKR
ncbi:hypothetical protein HPP92_024229 [Vanilla planifolia]|uniref:Uncharacterized protein n=1 Tax=Vanilla planifolia TaxID=51239 RepID=A0A835PM08_VANPL|nr:hypothetical protein HPP92_024229 [Vanilla planifolia]